MERFTIFIVIIGLGAASAIPSDDVNWKSNRELRYQYERADDGTPHLVDSWLKASDIAKADRFDPDQANEYHLFTRANPSVSQPLVYGYNSLLANSNFDSNRKTVVAVHCWGDSAQSNYYAVLVSSYLTAEDVNFIVVDWSVGASEPYLAAALNAVASGASVARFINWLNSVTGASLANYHVIGYSLGAQQVGVVGRNLNGDVAYITALDPATEWWNESGHKFRPDDGVYTEVIHTNVFNMGYKEPLGDVDFYPNGGDNNPGCDDDFCHHFRAFFFLGESLVSGGFTGVECATYQDAIARRCDLPGMLQMGGPTPKTGSTGVFYLETNAAPPFSRG